jgi:hypothetical protein
MPLPDLVDRHGPLTLLTVLSIVMLSVMDAFLTLELIGHGATELNPILNFYLKQSPLVFFCIKYLLTFAALLIVISIKDHAFFGVRVSKNFLLLLFLLAMGAIVQWELYLLSTRVG